MERRKEAGRKRHAPGTPEAKARDVARVAREEERKEGTLDDIVRKALAQAEALGRIQVPVADTLGAARIANAMSGLYRQAINGLRARGVVGDLPGGGRRTPPQDPLLPTVPEASPAEHDPLGELDS